MMAEPVHSVVLGQALCHILGLDPDTTARLTIEMEPSKLVTVLVQRTATPGEAEGITHLASRYRLVPVDNATSTGITTEAGQ